MLPISNQLMLLTFIILLFKSEKLSRLIIQSLTYYLQYFIFYQVLHGLLQPPKWSSCSPLCNPESVAYFTVFVIVDHIPDSNVYICRIGCCCCCSVTKSRPTLCNPMNCSTPSSSVLHSLLAIWTFVGKVISLLIQNMV